MHGQMKRNRGNAQDVVRRELTRSAIDLLGEIVHRHVAAAEIVCPPRLRNAGGRRRQRHFVTVKSRRSRCRAVLMEITSETVQPASAWRAGRSRRSAARAAPDRSRVIGFVNSSSRGETPTSHRGRRGAPLARRDDRAYAQYVREEQRSRRGCIAGRMQAAFHHGLVGQSPRVSGLFTHASGENLTWHFPKCFQTCRLPAVARLRSPSRKF